MQVQSVNRHAKKKYDNLRKAIEDVKIALEESAKLHSKLTDPKASAGWRVPTKDQIVGAHKKATDQLNTLRESTKRWEKELTSREWRV